MLGVGIVLLLTGYLLPDFVALPVHVDAVLLTAGWILTAVGAVVLAVDVTSGHRGGFNSRWWW